MPAPNRCAHRSRPDSPPLSPSHTSLPPPRLPLLLSHVQTGLAPRPRRYQHAHTPIRSLTTRRKCISDAPVDLSSLRRVSALAGTGSIPSQSPSAQVPPARGLGRSSTQSPRVLSTSMRIRYICEGRLVSPSQCLPFVQSSLLCFITARYRRTTKYK